MGFPLADHTHRVLTYFNRICHLYRNPTRRRSRDSRRNEEERFDSKYLSN